MMHWVQKLYMLIVALFLMAPLLVITSVSFNAKKFLSFPPKGFSLQWYAEIFTNDAWFMSLKSSLMVALLSASLAVLIALPVAYMMWRHQIRYARFLFTLGASPFVLPPIIMALASMLFFTTIGSHGQFVNVVIAHAIFLLALPLVTISLGLESISADILEASATLGASGRKIFTTVVLPLVVPYIISGFAFVFVLSLNEYIIAFMTVGFTVETLPIKIYNALRYGYTPVMASVAVLFIAVSLLVFGLIGRFGNLPKLLGAQDE